MLKKGKRYFRERKENKEPVTLVGLALYLGFTSRMTLVNYGRRPEFTETVDYLKSYIEEDYTTKLFERIGRNQQLDTHRLIFGLKALCGLKETDVVENVQTHKSADIDYSKLSSEDIEILDKILKKAHK